MCPWPSSLTAALRSRSPSGGSDRFLPWFITTTTSAGRCCCIRCGSIWNIRSLTTWARTSWFLEPPAQNSSSAKTSKALFFGQILPVEEARAPASAPGSAVTSPRLPSADILTSSRLVDGGTGGHRSLRRKQMCRSKKQLSCRPLSTNPDEFLKIRDELKLYNVTPTRN